MTCFRLVKVVHGFTVCLVIGLSFGSHATAQEAKKSVSLADRVSKLKAQSETSEKSETQARPVTNPLYLQILKSAALILCTSKDGSVCNGTGWVIDGGQRLLVTNHHVIEGVEECEVFFPELVNGQLVTDPTKSIVPSRSFKGRIVDSDQKCDLALIQLEKLPADVPELELAEASATAGQTVHSIAGSSVGSQSLWVYSTGHVRQVVKGQLANGFESILLESDMATNQGNSGGPVCDDHGKVVAVVEGHSTDARLVSIYVDLQAIGNYLADGLKCVEPKTVEDMKFAAKRHLEEKRPNIALRLVTAALKKDRDSAELFALRGQCWLANDDSETARGDFEEALKHDRTCAVAHEGLGLVEEFDGNYEASIKHYTQALRNEPDNIEYMLDRGRARFYLGALDVARKDFDAVLKKDSANFDAIRGKAFCDILDENYQAGLEGLDRVAAFFKDAEFFYYGGIAMNGLGDVEGAANVLSHAIELENDFMEAYYELGQIYVDAEEFEKAAELSLRGLEVTPDDAGCHYVLGAVMVGTNRIREGKSYLLKCLKLVEDDDELAEAAQELLDSLK